MSTEAEYDEIIAPMLLDVARKCEELGMSLIARVEWALDESGITQIGIGPETGIAQKLTQLAAHSRGNIDSLCIEAVKRFDCSQSIVLRNYAQGPRP